MPEPPCAQTGRPRRDWLARAASLALVAWAPARSIATEPSWPELELRTTEGRRLIADDRPWRATYFDFWASWCAPCRLSFPWMNEIHDRLGPAGLRIVAINLDRNSEDAQRFLQRHPARFEIALDAAAESAKRLEIGAMPTSILVAADRRIVFRHRGFRLEDRADLEQRLRAALA